MLKEFRDFLFRGNVIDLAVAVVMGAAFGAVVTAIVEGLLTPLIAAIFGEPDFAALTFTINDSVFRYGDVVNALISFALIGLAVFFVIVKPAIAYQARAARGDEGAEPSEEVRLLTEIRDSLQRR